MFSALRGTIIIIHPRWFYTTSLTIVTSMKSIVLTDFMEPDKVNQSAGSQSDGCHNKKKQTNKKTSVNKE